jgi:hypothetical protein
MPTKIRESRDYIHAKCRQTTTIDGPEFEVLANPLVGMVGTWCDHCEDHFPLREFAWADTRERITDYYDRHSAKATSLQKLLVSRKFLLAAGIVGFVAGAVGGAVLSNVLKGLPAAVLAIGGGLFTAVLVAVVDLLYVTPAVTRQALGTSDCRTLK